MAGRFAYPLQQCRRWWAQYVRDVIEQDPDVKKIMKKLKLNHIPMYNIGGYDKDMITGSSRGFLISNACYIPSQNHMVFTHITPLSRTERCPNLIVVCGHEAGHSLDYFLKGFMFFTANKPTKRKLLNMKMDTLRYMRKVINRQPVLEASKKYDMERLSEFIDYYPKLKKYKRLLAHRNIKERFADAIGWDFYRWCKATNKDVVKIEQLFWKRVNSQLHRSFVKEYWGEQLQKWLVEEIYKLPGYGKAK